MWLQKYRGVIAKIEVLETTSGQVLVKVVQWLQKLCIGDYKNVAFCSVTLDSTLRPLQGRSYWWKWYTVTTKTLYWGLQKCCILWCDIGLNLQVFSVVAVFFISLGDLERMLPECNRSTYKELWRNVTGTQKVPTNPCWCHHAGNTRQRQAGMQSACGGIGRMCQNFSECTWNAKIGQNAILWTPLFTPRARLDIPPC